MKKIVLLILLFSISFSCKKANNEELPNSKKITLTSVKKLNISDIPQNDRKITQQNGIISFDEFEVRREIDGLQEDYSARIVTLSPENNFVTNYNILEPTGFNTYCSMHVEEITPGNYYAKYYSPDGVLFMEASLNVILCL